MTRTKQTARKSTGGAPRRKAVATKAEPETAAGVECVVSDSPAAEAKAKAILARDGVVHVKGLFRAEEIAAFGRAYDTCWSEAKTRLAAPGPWRRRLYARMDPRTAPYTKALYHGVPYKVLNRADEPASEAIRMGPGRYDFTQGMAATCLESDACLRPDFARRVLWPPTDGGQAGAPPESEWVSYAGGLPTEGANPAGKWHRDVYSLWEEAPISDGALPPFYYTMIVPLTQIRAEDGPTQFKLGTHRAAPEAFASAPIAAADLDVGDALLFDGSVLHRGGPRAKEAGARHALYVVHHKWWYSDDDLACPRYVRVEDLSAAEVADIEAADPALRVVRRWALPRLPRHAAAAAVGAAAALAAVAAVGLARAQGGN